jgi:hypothetical protein
MFSKPSYLRSASFAAISTLPVIFGCAKANALDFNFDLTGNRGTVLGVVEGLSNDSTGPASAVMVTDLMPLLQTFPSGFPTNVNLTADPPWNVTTNSFTVSNGDITSANFLSQLIGSPATQLCFSTPSNTCNASNVGSGANNMGLVSQQTNFLFVTGTPTFTAIEAPPTPEIPLPATLPLFASGLGALGLLGWRRKRRARRAA